MRLINMVNICLVFFESGPHYAYEKVWYCFKTELTLIFLLSTTHSYPRLYFKPTELTLERQRRSNWSITLDLVTFNNNFGLLTVKKVSANSMHMIFWPCY